MPREVAPVAIGGGGMSVDWLTPDERADMGSTRNWTEEDLENPRRAEAARLAWRFDDPVFDDESLPAIIRAEAASGSRTAERSG